MNNSVSELYGHLDELRKRLTVIAVANIGAMMLLFSQASRVIDYFLKINPGMQLVYITPSELLVVYVQLSFVMAAIVCSPITGYEIWAFVEKGLYSREKKYILITLVFGVICFAAGVVFCYYLVLPTTLRFFIRIAITEVESMISIKSYISFISTMLLSACLSSDQARHSEAFLPEGKPRDHHCGDFRLCSGDHTAGCGIPADAGPAHGGAVPAESGDLHSGGSLQLPQKSSTG